MLKQFNLTGLVDKQVGMLSAGQSTRVMLAKAFLPNPDIVLLDEPTAALDPDVAQEVRSFVLERRAKHGTSFLFTSHNMNEVTVLCDRVLILKQGKIIADSTPRELTETITIAHVHLIISEGLEKLEHYCTSRNITYKQDGPSIKLEIEEKVIGRMLVDLVKDGVEYSQISIDKPKLEDYFMTIVANNKNR
jgi:ABC-2 type transport system ATP-binding protein